MVDHNRAYDGSAEINGIRQTKPQLLVGGDLGVSCLKHESTISLLDTELKLYHPNWLLTFLTDTVALIRSKIDLQNY